MANKMSYLRNAKGKTIMETALDLELPITTYQQYEAGTHEPPFHVLFKIADYYGCTLDYLLGRTEVFEKPAEKDLELAFQFNRLLRQEDIAAFNTLISHVEKRILD